MRYLRILIALLIIPPAAGLAMSFFELIITLGSKVTQKAVPFWLGAGGYFIFQLFFPRPIRTYIFGHELTHAIAGLLSGAKLRKFSVAASGGSVELTKTNVFITLAPYFLPIYTIMLVIVYWGGGKIWELQQYHGVFLFLAGFSLAFHFGLTQFALAQGQSDLQRFGIFFSGVFIVFVNCIVLVLLFKILFPEDIGLGAYFADGWLKTRLILDFAAETVKKVWLYSR